MKWMFVWGVSEMGVCLGCGLEVEGVGGGGVFVDVSTLERGPVLTKP